MPAYHDTGFVVREPAWHGLSDVLEDWPGSKEAARSLAGLDWEPTTRPLYDRVEAENDDGEITVIYEPYEEYKIIGRSDRPRARLAITTDTYELIPNGEMFDCVEAFLGEANIKFDTAGSASEGRMVYTTVYLDEPWQAPGDQSPTYPYLVLLNRHDGKGAFKVAYVKFRVVCANTFQAADSASDRDGTGYSFRHTLNWRDKVDEARQAINGARDDFEEWKQIASDLCLIGATHMQKRKFIERFIPYPPGDVISDRVKSNIEDARGKMWATLNGPTCEGISDTAYGLVQASGEYLDHLRGFKNRGTYLNRTLLRPEPLKGKAMKLAREVCLASN